MIMITWANLFSIASKIKVEKTNFNWVPFNELKTGLIKSFEAKKIKYFTSLSNIKCRNKKSF